MASVESLAILQLSGIINKFSKCSTICSLTSSEPTFSKQCISIGLAHHPRAGPQHALNAEDGSAVVRVLVTDLDPTDLETLVALCDMLAAVAAHGTPVVAVCTLVRLHVAVRVHVAHVLAQLADCMCHVVAEVTVERATLMDPLDVTLKRRQKSARQQTIMNDVKYFSAEWCKVIGSNCNN